MSERGSPNLEVLGSMVMQSIKIKGVSSTSGYLDKLAFNLD